jgi:hypothetical protein
MSYAAYTHMTGALKNHHVFLSVFDHGVSNLQRQSEQKKKKGHMVLLGWHYLSQCAGTGCSPDSFWSASIQYMYFTCATLELGAQVCRLSKYMDRQADLQHVHS